MNEVGNRIIKFRESIGFKKQADFLEALKGKIGKGISQANLSHWENGVDMPSYPKLKLIKDAFPEFDIDFILTGEPVNSLKMHNLKEVVKLHPWNEEPRTWVDEKIKHLEEVIKLKDEIIKELRNNK